MNWCRRASGFSILVMTASFSLSALLPAQSAPRWSLQADTDAMTDNVDISISRLADSPVSPSVGPTFTPRLIVRCSPKGQGTSSLYKTELEIYSEIAPQRSFEDLKQAVLLRFDSATPTQVEFDVSISALDGWLILSLSGIEDARTAADRILWDLAHSHRLLVRYFLGTGEQVTARFTLPSDTGAVLGRALSSCDVAVPKSDPR